MNGILPNIPSTRPRISHTDNPSSSNALSMSKEDIRSSQLATRARAGDYDDELILEQLARNRVFLTDDGLQKLRSSFVIVVGCGGVGSHAAAALARSGVSRIRLIDFDQVTLSSLNRHALATLADVGTPKVHCIRRRLEQIVPWTHFDCRNELFGPSTADAQLGPWSEASDLATTTPGQQGSAQPSYIIDAIDNIDSKVALLAYCHEHSLPVVSSMGAGCKSDPTRVFLGDISTSQEDPLSRATRRLLRKQGITQGIPVIFSTEKPGPGKATLLPLPDEEYARGKVGELAPMANFRARILPVLGTMPAVFGLVAANHVILALTGYPHEYAQGKFREKLYDGVLSSLAGLEERLSRANGEDSLGLRLSLTVEDAGYVIEEVYRGKSVVSGLPTRLALIRWRAPSDGKYVDPSYGDKQRKGRVALDELVCVTKEEAQLHEKEVLRGGKKVEDVYEERVLKLVEQRMAEERRFAAYR